MWEGWPCFPYLKAFLQTSNNITTKGVFVRKVISLDFE